MALMKVFSQTGCLPFIYTKCCEDSTSLQNVTGALLTGYGHGLFTGWVVFTGNWINKKGLLASSCWQEMLRLRIEGDHSFMVLPPGAEPGTKTSGWQLKLITLF